MSSRSSRRKASIQATAPATAFAPPVKPSAPPRPLPSWAWIVLVLLAAVLLSTLFTGPAGDTDTWWQLKTGQYILQQHRLPVPDPFAWTTYLGKPSYPGEETTRYFNLTHEWLAQVILYASYASGGFTGLILLRAICLIAFCGIAGMIAYRRRSNYYLAIGVALASAWIVRAFAADRPQYFTYLFLALAVLILESRRRLWLLPPLLLVWANCHAGFIMGWVAMGCYCLEALYFRWRGKPLADEKRLWTMCGLAVVASGLNPNGFHVVPVLSYYRNSVLQTSIWEWQRPKYWDVTPFTVLLYGSIASLLVNFRKSRPSEWLFLGVCAASALMAYRNLFLIGFWSPVVIATYLPARTDRKTSAPWLVALAVACAGIYAVSLNVSLPALAAIAICVCLLASGRYAPVAAGLTALLLITGTVSRAIDRRAFQFYEASWQAPSAAADFLLRHHVKGRIFNTYTQGGYLLWRLWPEQRVFVDGRALNEQVWRDTTRIEMNAEAIGGKSGEELLKDYGIDVIVMEGFEIFAGSAYYLPAALADSTQKEWKLVYWDDHDVIFMRNPPSDIPPLNSAEAVVSMERQCALLVQHGAPLCSRGLMDIFGRLGDRVRYQRWAAVFQQNRAATSAYTVERP